MDKRKLLLTALDLLDTLSERDAKLTETFGEGCDFLSPVFDRIDAVFREILGVEDDDFWDDVAAEWIFSLYLTGGTSRDGLMEFFEKIDEYQKGYQEMNRALEVD